MQNTKHYCHISYIFLMDRSWLILIISLPTKNTTGRMRVWRALKALGCGVLRDGVYLLPHRPEFRQAFQVQAKKSRPVAAMLIYLLLTVRIRSSKACSKHCSIVSDDYAKLLEVLRQTAQALESEDARQLQRRVLRLRKDFETLAALDFFPGGAREQVASVLDDLEHTISERCHRMNLMQCSAGSNVLQRQDYQGRIWSTRQRPGSTGSPVPG